MAVTDREAGPTSILQAIILGITQGLTEFAPISSSGHLILVPWLFDWPILQDPDLNKSFDVALHIGTLIGALAYFWRDIARYSVALAGSVKRRRIETADERIAWAIVAGTIPGAIAGATLEDLIQEKLGQPWLIAVMLAVFGVVLYVVDRAARSDRSIRDLTVRDGLILGFAQAVSLQPGVSRSGITITAARARGLDRESAARFSFLLSLPIIAGAGLFKGVDLLKTGLPPGFAGPFFWGMVSSAVSGFLVIWGLLAYLRRRDFAVFMIYRLVVAGIVFAVIVSGARPASGV